MLPIKVSEMHDSEDLPETIKQIQLCLEPYIKPRQEVTHIRRALAAQLNSHVEAEDGHRLSMPLSLVDATSKVEAASGGVRGIRKEYLRCVKANVKARKEYAKVSKEPQTQVTRSEAREHPNRLNDSEASLELFLDLIKQQQKHERLHIIQEYIDLLAQKPAAASEYLDLKTVLKDVVSPPQVPSEVTATVHIPQISERMDLNGLVNKLEKSVLRAKLRLRKEQNLLAKVKARTQLLEGHASISYESRLHAIGSTRNELINWIEGELSTTGEPSLPIANNQDAASFGEKGKDYINSQTVLIRSHYARYTQVRQELIQAVTGNFVPQALVTTHDEAEVPAPKLQAESNLTMIHLLYPHLKELVSLANEQKFTIQLKSYLTISLAKQLKEAGQGLDRLADESHLLPTYTTPAVLSQRKGVDSSASFGDEILNGEKPNSSRLAQPWIFAARSATSSTADTISAQLEVGERALGKTHDTLLRLRSLLGNSIRFGGRDGDERVFDNRNGLDTTEKRDVWAALDGNLGVINRDDTKQA